MKAPDWDDALLTDHRRYVSVPAAQQAFDALVLAAILLPNYECLPAWHGEIRDFRYKDRATGEWPFAFIVNRKHLLFYVRKQGLARVAGGIAALKERLGKVSKNTAGEYTVYVESSDAAHRLVDLLFGKAHSVATTVKHWWVNHRQTPRQETEGGYLWTAGTSKSATGNASFENLIAVQPGDVIFSFGDGVVGAVGVALGRAREAPDPAPIESAGKKRKAVFGRQLP